MSFFSSMLVYTGGIITGIVLGCLLGLIIMAAAPVVMVVLIVKRNSIKAAFNAKKVRIFVFIQLWYNYLTWCVLFLPDLVVNKGLGANSGYSVRCRFGCS